MRRLISLLTAAALVAAPLATAGVAMADQHGGGGRREQGGGHWNGGGNGGGHWNGAGRGGPMPAAPVFRGGGDYRGGGRNERIDPRMDPRGEFRGESRGEPRGDYRSESRVDPRYDPRGYGAPPSAYRAAPRRGGYLGPGAGGEVIQDYGRYRLRPPPRGYEWVRVGGGMALVSNATGQVFDVVPY